MLASLVLTATIAPAAPIPRDTVPPPTGPAPKVLVLKANSAGQVIVTGFTSEKRKVKSATVVVENGKQVQKIIDREITVNMPFQKPLADLGAKFTTADGTELTADAVSRRAKDGLTVLVSADGKPVEKGWLRAVGRDTVVLTADGIGSVMFNHGPAFATTTPAPQLMLLAVDMTDGKVKVPVTPVAGANNAGGAPGVIIGGRINRVPFVVDDATAAPTDPNAKPAVDGKKPLEDVKFEAYTTDGKQVERTEAVARLKSGGLVLIAGSNQLPDAAYLKPFQGDLMVLVSPELAGSGGLPVRSGIIRQPIQAVPLPAPIAPRVAAPVPAPILKNLPAPVEK